MPTLRRDSLYTVVMRSAHDWVGSNGFSGHAGMTASWSEIDGQQDWVLDQQATASASSWSVIGRQQDQLQRSAGTAADKNIVSEQYEHFRLSAGTTAIWSIVRGR